jgi:hypothetical protein
MSTNELGMEDMPAISGTGRYRQKDHGPRQDLGKSVRPYLKSNLSKNDLRIWLK